MAQKRRSRRQRLAQPTAMRLMPRDIEVIEAVYRHRVLTQRQIQTLLFPSAETTQHRLERLFDNGYLDRRFLNVSMGEGGSPTLYILDRRGAEILRTEKGYDEIKWFSSSKDLTDLFMSHTTAINDFLVSVRRSCLQNGFVFEEERWRTEMDIKADYDYVETRHPTTGRRERIPIAPDAFFSIAAYGRRFPFMLELDRGTMSLKRFKQKVRGYMAYLESGGYSKRFGLKTVRVLTVISTKAQAGGVKRLEHLKQVTEEITAERIFWFVSLQELAGQDALRQPLWYQATVAERQSLITA